jgi:hypothetical protein
LLPKLTVAIKGRGYTDITMIEAKLWDALDKFQSFKLTNCFERWHDCWASCIKSQGDYVEGDDIDQQVLLLRIDKIQSGNCLIAPHIIHIVW